MSKVYIITSGSYSDYRIEGIFLDKILAEETLKKCKEQSEEYGDLEELDITESPPKLYWYRAEINSYTGYLKDRTKLEIALWNMHVTSILRKKNQWRDEYIEAYGSTEEEAIENAKMARKEYIAGNK